MGRAPCCSKIGLQKGPWTAKEDELLKNYIQSHGQGHWRSLYCPKKPMWKELQIEMDELFAARYQERCRLPGRTDNEIKNYWNTHLNKKLKTNAIINNDNKYGFNKNVGGLVVIKPKPIRVTSRLISSTHLCMFNKDISNEYYNINGICNINNIGMSGTDQNCNNICSDNYYANIGIEDIKFVDCLASEKNEHQETAAAISNERTLEKVYKEYLQLLNT